MPFEVGYASDPGYRRVVNEDAVLVCVGPTGDWVLAIVADGMGGLTEGRLASWLAVEKFEALVSTRGVAATSKDLLAAYADANRAIWDLSGLNRARMGTTLVCCILTDNEAMVANVGDCRAYLVHKGALRRLTTDHNAGMEQVHAGSMTEAEVRASPIRRIVTRSLGTQAIPPEVDITRVGLNQGDEIVLCSDGLHGVLTDEELTARLQATSPQEAAGALVQAANRAGAPDNVSVVIVRAEGG